MSQFKKMTRRARVLVIFKRTISVKVVFIRLGATGFPMAGRTLEYPFSAMGDGAALEIDERSKFDFGFAVA
jgi:hypothetical protein